MSRWTRPAEGPSRWMLSRYQGRRRKVSKLNYCQHHLVKHSLKLNLKASWTMRVSLHLVLLACGRADAGSVSDIERAWVGWDQGEVQKLR